MAARPENDFATIRDMRDQLSKLVAGGLGDLPVQILVVPDSTMQAVAISIGGGNIKPALMIEFDACGGRMAASMISTDRLSRDGGMPSMRRN